MPETRPVSSLSPDLLCQGTSILSAEHAASLCRCYEEKQSPLQEHLRACSLRGECGKGRDGVRVPFQKMHAAWEVLVLRKESHFKQSRNQDSCLQPKFLSSEICCG